MGWNPWSSVSEGSTKPGGAITAVAVGAGQFALFLADPRGGIYTALGGPKLGWGSMVQCVGRQHGPRRIGYRSHNLQFTNELYRRG